MFIRRLMILCFWVLNWGNHWSLIILMESSRLQVWMPIIALVFDYLLIYLIGFFLVLPSILYGGSLEDWLCLAHKHYSLFLVYLVYVF